MRVTLIRILKHGLPTALLLAVVGYLLGELAAVWVTSQPPSRAVAQANAETPSKTQNPIGPRTDPEVVQALRYELPLRMASWGLGLVIVCELLLSLCRGKSPTRVERQPLVPPTDAEVEALLNQLLQQAEAAEAARQATAAKLADTPLPDAACPDQSQADNTPVTN